MLEVLKELEKLVVLEVPEVMLCVLTLFAGGAAGCDWR